MPNPDLLVSRPTLTDAQVITTALGALRLQAESKADIWRLLTENYVVDLDAVATLLPPERPEPLWLRPRN